MSELKIIDDNMDLWTRAYSDDLWAGISHWFPQAPQEIRDAVQGLQVAINRSEYIGEYEAFLGIRVEPLR